MRGFFCHEQTVHFKVTHLSYSLISSFFTRATFQHISRFRDRDFFLKKNLWRVFTGMSVCYVKISRVVIFMSVDYS